MRILIVGAAGTLGTAVCDALGRRGHDLVTVGRTSGDIRCDVTKPEQLQRMWESVGRVDAVAITAGAVPFAPLPELDEAEYVNAFEGKVLSQINLVRTGLSHVADRGSFTLITGILAREPIVTGAAAAVANGAVEAFVRAAALEMAPQRINAVSPSVFTESLNDLGGLFPGYKPADLVDVARAYVKSIEGAATGQVVEVP